MTLHGAIEEVLTRAGRPLTPRQIADEVNRRGLYRRGDGTPLPSGQVSARVRNYSRLFEKRSDGVWLVGWTGRGGIEATLLDPAHFRSARGVDNAVPDEFGLYAIRAREVEVLPEPFRTIARKRGSSLIYLGEATKQTLKARFLHTQLRGRGHGTFFRSIGAVLGYRPPVGSLVGKRNQRNYRFSPADTAAVVEWINENLLVSWVAFDVSANVEKTALIRAHTPLLNLRANSAALQELETLRALCVEIATAETPG